MCSLDKSLSLTVTLIMTCPDQRNTPRACTPSLATRNLSASPQAHSKRKRKQTNALPAADGEPRCSASSARKAPLGTGARTQGGMRFSRLKRGGVRLVVGSRPLAEAATWHPRSAIVGAEGAHASHAPAASGEGATPQSCPTLVSGGRAPRAHTPAEEAHASRASLCGRSARPLVLHTTPLASSPPPLASHAPLVRTERTLRRVPAASWHVPAASERRLPSSLRTDHPQGQGLVRGPGHLAAIRAALDNERFVLAAASACIQEASCCV